MKIIIAIDRPVVELNLMGYANASQLGSGLRQRLYSRAFIVGDLRKAEDRIVYLVLDTHSGDTAIRHGIISGLRDLGPRYSAYKEHNVAVTGTHSHSGPGAWLNYLLPQITSKGFDKQSYEAIVRGALLSIQRAHESLAAGQLDVATAEVHDANTNRSPFAYLANPVEERDRYPYNVDKTMTLLRFRHSGDGREIGCLTWFAVHGTSMLGNNTLITGDNKGVAARLLEQQMQEEDNSATSNFVAGFSQANVGDTSPNILGAYCEDGSNKPCKFEDSTCDGKSELCHGRGPFYGLNDSGTKSCFEIGKRQYAAAYELLQKMRTNTAISLSPLVGSTIKSFHTFVDLAEYKFQRPDGRNLSTCSAALGYSFAAGTTDGPGEFDFTQRKGGRAESNKLWKTVRTLLHKPTSEQKHCQHPKEILLDVGDSKKPYAWSPNIVDIQVFRIGQLILIASPGEATTMAGRRWREAVKEAFVKQRSTSEEQHEEPMVLLGGPANTYAHYIATEEEYSVQRYEGASTLHGPHTLDAYINLTLTYLPYIFNPTLPSPLPLPPSGVSPPINTNRSLSFINGVAYDSAGFGRQFGQTVKDVRTVKDGAYYTHGDVVVVRFIGANPRNNLRLEDTYVAVEQLRESSVEAGHEGSKEGDDDIMLWTRVRDDADWDLVFEWFRTSTLLGTSEVEARWEIGSREDRDSGQVLRRGGKPWCSSDAAPGKYRLRYWGDAKSVGGMITGFEGTSGIFEIR